MEKLKSDYEHYEIDATVIMTITDKVNEIIDWINASERRVKESADMLEGALARLDKGGWKLEKEVKEE